MKLSQKYQRSFSKMPEEPGQSSYKRNHSGRTNYYIIYVLSLLERRCMQLSPNFPNFVENDPMAESLGFIFCE